MQKQEIEALQMAAFLDHIGRVTPAEVPAPPNYSPAAVEEPSEIRIPRDLAVQLVGSDAGKERRFRPQSHMTKDATPEEQAAIEEVMRPFLEAEIKRRHEDKTHRVREFTAKVTPPQARAIKKYCLAYAAHLKQHLAKHPGDERYHRSGQRLEQVYGVLDQINTALGTPWDDGRSLEDCVAQVEHTLEQLCRELDMLGERVVDTNHTSERADALMDFAATVKAFTAQQQSRGAAVREFIAAGSRNTA